MTPSKALVATITAATLALGLTACGAGQSPSGPSGKGGTIASHLIMGGPPEFQTRVDGLPGLKKHYGVVFGKFTPTDEAGPVTVNALKNGQVDAADLFTTNPSIKADGFVVLTDPKHDFAAQNILPIIAKAKATPGVTGVINTLSKKLTTTGLTQLISQAINNKENPTAIAQGWLKQNGLSAKGTKAKGVSVVVGSANFPENVILAEIYATALQDQGASVSTKLNIGSREKYFAALKSGSLTLFPEYVGALLQYLNPKATQTAPQAAYAALKKALPSNLEALPMSSAKDSDAIVVTKATAQKYHLHSIADLAKKMK